MLFGIVASALRSDGKHAKEHEDFLRLLYNPLFLHGVVKYI